MMFRFVCRGWNCSEYMDDCIYSLQAQTIKDWTAILILDPGEDDSIIKATEWSERDKRITVYANSKRMGVCHNMWHGIKFAGKDPDDIICIVDLDDVIPYYALEEISKTYREHPGCMCTYGSYSRMSDGNKNWVSRPYPLGVSVRGHRWHASHLKTFRFGVFDHIPQDYFKHKNEWGLAASDLALMFCVIELVGLRRCYHIKKPIYIYRNQSPIKLNRGTQKLWEHRFRKKIPLKRLY